MNSIRLGALAFSVSVLAFAPQMSFASAEKCVAIFSKSAKDIRVRELIAKIEINNEQSESPVAKKTVKSISKFLGEDAAASNLRDDLRVLSDENYVDVLTLLLNSTSPRELRAKSSNFNSVYLFQTVFADGAYRKNDQIGVILEQVLDQKMVDAEDGLTYSGLVKMAQAQSVEKRVLDKVSQLGISSSDWSSHVSAMNMWANVSPFQPSAAVKIFELGTRTQFVNFRGKGHAAQLLNELGRGDLASLMMAQNEAQRATRDSSSSDAGFSAAITVGRMAYPGNLEKLVREMADSHGVKIDAKTKFGVIERTVSFTVYGETKKIESFKKAFDNIEEGY